MFFPTLESMELITKNKSLREQVFQAFDTRGISIRFIIQKESMHVSCIAP